MIRNIDAMVATFILNSTKSKAMKMARQLSECSPAEWQFNFKTTEYPEHANELAYHSAAGSHVIVPIGGDGTISECMQGMMRWKEENPQCPLPMLAPIAAGTGNDFLRNFSFKASTQSIIDRLLSPSKHSIDIGRIHFTEGSKRYFINEISAGLGPEVVSNLASISAMLPGKLRFGIAIVKTFPFYRKKMITIKSENWQWCGDAMAVVIANGKYFGGGIGIAPDACISDGILDITIIGNVTMADYLLNVPALQKGRKIVHPEVFYFQATKVEISSKSMTEIDGERGGRSEAQIDVIPSALTII